MMLRQKTGPGGPLQLAARQANGGEIVLGQAAWERAMYLTVKEAARELGGVSPSLVYALCKAGKLEHHRVGVRRGVIRIPTAAVDRLKAEGRGRVAAEHPPLKHLSGD